ncbi:hypothetical protein DS891_14255 [Pseudoalteromonas sp. JC28]|uniref:hypothetical protein n=1 Tax=Pseudoalteromonas sp. JC28 TaxID=2267617 RepID=UPI001574052E|nr:hypothetical protein [Pseudoalteromonas sp. JC28]NSY34703.1 hypothetical protein [Pseudoalteromonas sp. JC28]
MSDISREWRVEMKSLLVLTNERIEHYWGVISCYQKLTQEEKEEVKAVVRENTAAVELIRCDIATLNERGVIDISEALQELLDELLGCEMCQSVGREVVGLVTQNSPTGEVVDWWLCSDCIQYFEENGAPGSVIRKVEGVVK